MKTKVLTICLFLFTSQVFSEECKGTDISKWSNCSGTVHTQDGRQYTSEFKNGKPNGHGEYLFPDGTKYTG